MLGATRATPHPGTATRSATVASRGALDSAAILEAITPGTRATPMITLIDDAVAELATAVDELRQIAQGLRPSSLDDGLGSALSTLTRRLVPGSRPGMDLDIAADVRNAALPDDVATTACYVASEAVTNTLSPSSCCRST
jgi:signal transduction histidine kinase